ncbi:hypothetical protein M9H77_35898 [Catharanthus roseus]|uniref:Uncharacterized protein n=1 Tax=Catharanthus roseus TaxID=4058 RepID=A0ACB9ZQM8_CATRO|nr:hypothetical protein M9H77_35898 [Catharanthus roseus]
MAPNLYFLLILSLSFLQFFFFGNTATNPPPMPPVNFIGRVGTKSSPVTIRCKVNVFQYIERSIVNGQKFSILPTNKDVYYCSAMWTRYFAGIQAFNRTRDGGHPSIFWKINEEGFHLSYDNRKYVLDTPWETD